MDEKKYKIWYKQFDESGNEIGRGVYHKEYEYLGHASRYAREMYGKRKDIEYVVAWRDPWIDYHKIVHCDICGTVYNRPVCHEGWDKGDTVMLGNRTGSYSLGDGVHRYLICPGCASRVNDFVRDLALDIHRHRGATK